MAKHGKKYAAAAAKVEKDTLYTLEDAAKLAVETSTTKFDASVEVHINLNVDVRHADQIVRGIVVLPHGTGKKVRIAAFVESDQVAAAKKAGADLAGMEDLINEVKKGNIEFDIAIAQPAVMKDLGQIARILGPKGLMPSPKAGTVTDNVVATIEEIKKGQVEYRTDKTGIIHCIAGKTSFGGAKIFENVKTIVDAVLAAKPAAVKSSYVKSVTLASSMGPGVKVNPSSLK